MSNFSERIDAGGYVSEDYFDAAIAEWEAGPQSETASSHLGISIDEFAYICLATDDWGTVIDNIRLGRIEEANRSK